MAQLCEVPKTIPVFERHTILLQVQALFTLCLLLSVPARPLRFSRVETAAAVSPWAISLRREGPCKGRTGKTGARRADNSPMVLTAR